MKAILCDALEKVFPNQQPKASNIQDYTVLKNQRVSFQIVVDQPCILNYKSDLEIHIYKMNEIYCNNPTNHNSYDQDYLFTTPKSAPDYLIETCQNNQEGYQSFYIDVIGNKTGNFEIQIEDVIVHVEVFPFELKHDHGFKFTQWFHLDSILNYYQVDLFSDQFYSILDCSIEHYAKFRNMLLVPVFTPPLDTEIGMERRKVQLVNITYDGTYHFNYKELERYIFIAKSHGIEYFEICHLFSQWGALCAPNIYINNQLRFGWHTSSDDKDYLDFLNIFLVDLKQELKHLGIFEYCYFHISDEPDLQAKQYLTARKSVDDVLGDCKIMEALRDYEYYASGMVNIPVCSTKYIQPFIEHHVDELWCYYCCVETKEVPNHFIALPLWRCRALGILLYYFNIKGFLHWGYDFYNDENSHHFADPYNNADGNGGYPSGDPFIVYPGKEGITIDSIRNKTLEDALTDYHTLKYLESFIGRKKVIELLPEKLTFTRYPTDSNYYIQLRIKLDRLLQKEICKR